MLLDAAAWLSMAAPRTAASNSPHRATAVKVEGGLSIGITEVHSDDFINIRELLAEQRGRYAFLAIGIEAYVGVRADPVASCLNSGMEFPCGFTLVSGIHRWA